MPTPPEEPALRFPQGGIVNDETFGDMFIGRLPLTTIRDPMSGLLQGVDVMDIREIALVFDQKPRGSAFSR